MIRTAILSILLCLVIISAHPFGPLRPLALELWPYFNALGIDVSMQPITFDMPMMYDPKDRVNIYPREMKVIYRTEEEEIIIPMRSLSLHRFRLPALLFVEWSLEGVDTRVYVHAMCRELEHLHGPGIEFMIHVDVDDQKVTRYGFNKFHPCE